MIELIRKQRQAEFPSVYVFLKRDIIFSYLTKV